MELHYFRLSLKARSDADLFEPKNSEGEALSREDWLRHVFSRRHEFTHFNNKFVYVSELRMQTDDHDVMVGWIARPTVRTELTPPDEGLILTEHTSWQAALVVVDPTVHSDGQRVVVQHEGNVGIPQAVFKSLVQHVTTADVIPFDMQVFPILESGTFWAFLQDNAQIKSITFDVAVPNMFNGKDDFERELRSLRDTENVSNVKATIESDTALKVDTVRIAEIVDYTEKGAGELSARAVNGTIYSSGEHIQTLRIEIVVVPGDKPSFLRQLRNLLDRIF